MPFTTVFETDIKRNQFGIGGDDYFGCVRTAFFAGSCQVHHTLFAVGADEVIQNIVLLDGQRGLHLKNVQIRAEVKVHILTLELGFEGDYVMFFLFNIKAVMAMGAIGAEVGFEFQILYVIIQHFLTALTN
jgi:hypothetical protein